VEGLSLGSMLAKIVSIDQRQIESIEERLRINKKTCHSEISFFISLFVNVYNQLVWAG
jgi:hypothetical protein